MLVEMIQFASYLRRVLCKNKTRLIVPRINGPSVSHTFSVASKSCSMSHTFLVASKSFGVAVDPVVAVAICHLKPFDITQLFYRFKINWYSMSLTFSVSKSYDMSHTFSVASKSCDMSHTFSVASKSCDMSHTFSVASKPCDMSHTFFVASKPCGMSHTFSVVYKSCGDVNRLVVLPSVVTTKEQLFSSCGI